MDYGISTSGFADERLGSHVLDRVLAAGLKEIEIFAARQHINYCDPNHVRDVAQWFEDHNLSLYSVHAPLYADESWGRLGGLAVSIAYLERRHRIDSMDEIKRALEMAEHLPFRYLVLHLGRFEEEYDLRKFDAAFTSIEHLKIFAKERGTCLLLENTPGELSTPERLVQFLNYTRLDDVKVCFDTGHAHMGAGVRPSFQILKDRVACVHVHDNHREKDEHLLPFEGGIDWGETTGDLRGLGTGEARVPALFELHPGNSNGFSRVREVIGRMESLNR